ncbi:MAG: hypothetical protein AB1529_07775 [Candidatus Micrarchaeota archaeon]
MRKLAPPALNPPARPRAAHTPLLDNLVCWDLDETLGRFYGIAAERNGYRYEGTDGLRPGIKAVLASLSGIGLSHILTTAAPDDYAHEALRRFGLAGFFSGVFTEKTILSGGRKDYPVVAEALGLQEEDFWRRALFVGDIHQIDRPPRGVFIYEPHAPSYSAHIPGAIIGLLLQEGGGDAAEGFSKMFLKGCLAPAGNSDAPLHPASSLRSESFTARMYYEGVTGIIRVEEAAAAFRLPLEAP